MGAPAGPDIRPVAADEVRTFIRSIDAAFGEHTEDELADLFVPTIDPTRTRAVYEGGRIVATSGSIAFDLTLPGSGPGSTPPTIPMEGVSYVGVLPTHRRRGLLTAMMRRQLDDFRADGIAVGGLTASESVIYGRFGYGLATTALDVEISTTHSSFVRPVADTGRCVLLDKPEAAKVIPEIHDRARKARPGEITRSEQYWALRLADHKDLREGWGALFHVVHETATGEPDGYLEYRVKQGWDHDLPSNELQVEDLHALSPETEVALWRFALDVDLVARVRGTRVPPDDRLRWLLADPRRLRVLDRHDHLWVRLVDVGVALAARGYETEDELVLDVRDEFCPWNAGRWRLSAGPDGASCERVQRAGAGAGADLELTAADLGALYLGGVSASTLVRAGRVAELRPAAARRADHLFASDPVPWCSTGF